MDILELFKRQLLEDKSTSSKSTLKNYLSDVRHFILWFERTTHSSFEANRVSSDILSLYQKTLGGVIENGNINTSAQLSTASMKRHLSSLRKFFAILEKSNDISINPFVQIQPEITEEPTDFWHLKSFKDFLQLQKSSKITVKNYISDIAGFARWYEETILPGLEKPLSSTGGFYLITQEIVEDYRKRLLEIQNAAPRTVNRKLSALRKYLNFATQKGFVTPNELTIDPVKLYEEKLNLSEAPSVELSELPKAAPKPKTYSIIPPVRLLQKLIVYPYLALEERTATTIATFIAGKPLSGIEKLSPKLTKIIEAKNTLRSNTNSVGNLLGIRNVSKEFYAPDKVSLLGTPLYKRAIYHFRFTRPNWYKRYHNYSFVHYVHFALLVIFASGVGIALYQNLVAKKQLPTFATATAPPRIISFQGRLTDNLDNPITSTSALRFAIYNDASASGGALLWQEAITNIVPDQDGIFSILLGGGTQIPSTVFTDNSQIYLGVTVGTTSELTPRQRIASVGYATNAEFLQGQPPTTQAGLTSFANVILALDSSGNLTLADSGATDHTFQVSNGAFNLKGQTLYLTTNSGSGGNVILSPDGLGKIDIQRPIINTTTMGNLVSGGVEVNDRFGVLATESAVAAFIVNNNTSGGDIFAASSSGTTRFKIANDGTLTDSFYNTVGGILYGSNTSGTFAQTTAGSLGQCLQSTAGGTPTWSNCGGSDWRTSLGAISPNNDTLDLLVGGITTASAKFRFINVNTGTPVASVSANSGNNATFISGDGTLGTTNRATLTIGNSSTYNTTGNLLFNPNGIGKIGIGTTSPLIGFDLRGNSGTTPAASISANTSYATLLVDNSGGGDLIAASASGVPNFVVKNNGDVIVGQGGGGKITVSVIDPYLVQNQKTTGTQSLTFQTMGATNADFIFKNTSTTLSTLTQAGQLQLPVTGSTGGIVIGGDTQIFRGSADRLDLASGDSFNVVSGNLQIGGTTVIDSSRNGTFQTLNITGGCTGCTTGAPSPFQAANGAIVPLNGTLDLLVGSQATTSAKFAVLNLGNGGTPTASVSSGLSGSSMYLTADGTLATQNRGNLTIGNSSTYNTSGNVLINPNGTGNIGIGTTSPIAPFHFESSVQNSLTDLAGAAAKTSSLTNLTSTDTSTATLKASAFQLTYDPASNPISSKITSSLHSFVSVPSTNTQNLSNVDLRGFIALADQRGTGTVGIVTGMLGQARNTSTGTVTNLNSISAAATNSNASGTVGTLKYLNLIDLQSSGTITDTYGLYIGDITTGTQTNTPFSIYASDTGTYNYLGGNTGIGTTTPTAKLDVNGTASVSGVFKLYGTPTIQSTANQTLTLGGDTTGNIILSPSNGLGRVGIGTNNPTASLHLFKSGTNDPEAIFENGTGGSIMITSASNTIYQKLINVPGNDNFLTGSLAGDSGIVFANGGNYLIGVSAGYVSQYFKSNNTIGLGTNSPTSELHVTRPLTYGTTGKALAIFDQIENQDILTASSGGTTRFVIKNDGTASSSAGFTIDGSGALQSTKNQTLTIGGDSTGSIVLSPNNGSGSLRFTNFTTNGGVLYTNAAGVLAQTAGGTGTQCLLGNLSWGSCGTGTTLSPFQEANGAIIPFQPSEDFLIGGTSTGSAKFAILNVNNGVPTASVSSGLNGTASLHDANGNFQTANKMTLTLGGGNTGNIVIQGNGTTTIVDQTIRLNAINPTFSANGSSTLTLNNNSTGNIQFFSSSNTLTSAGALSIAGSATINGGTVQLANGAQGTIQTASNADILITAGSGTINLNTVSNGPILTGSGLTTLGGGLTVNGATTTFGNAAPLVTTGTNTDLTITPNGTGNLIITSDFNTGVRIGSSSNIPALLSVSGGIGSNAGFILNRVGTTDDIFAASSSGTTKFVIKNDGTASTSGTFVLDGAGSLQTTKNQTLTIGGNSTGNIVFSPNNGSGNIRFSNFTTNNGILYTNGSGVLTQTGAGSALQCLLGDLTWGSCGTGTNRSPFQESLGAIVPNNSTEDFLIGGQATTSAKFAVLNIAGPNGTVPTASVSSGLNGTGAYFDANGNFNTVNNMSLILGSATTGNILLNPTVGGKFVGIGTYTPKTLLDIQGTTTAVASVSATTNGNGTAVYIDGTGSLQSVRNNTLTIGGSTTGDIQFKPGGSTSSLYLSTNTGFVGIGTANPAFKFDLQRDTAATNGEHPIASITDSTASDKGLRLGYQADGSSITAGYIRSTNGIDLRLSTSGTVNVTGGGITLTNTGAVGLGTYAPVSQLFVTRPLTLAVTGRALAIFDQLENQDILTASAGGSTKFTIKNDGTASSSAGFTINGAGNIQSTNNQTLTIGGSSTGFINIDSNSGQINLFDNTNINGNLTGLTGLTLASGAITLGGTTGASTQCITGGATAAWTTCATGYSSPFRELLGSVVQLNTTEDFLAGGQASTSATFKVTGQGNPFAGTQVGASVSANTSFAGFIADNRGSGDLFTASSAGMTRFTIRANGNVGIGTNLPGDKLEIKGIGGTSAYIGTNVSGLATVMGLQLNSSLALNGQNYAVEQDTAHTYVNAPLNGNLYFRYGNTDRNIMLGSSGNFGLGTITPLSALHVTHPLTLGANGKALAIFDQIENQDILTASSGGVTKFTIRNDGSASSSAGFTFDAAGSLQTTKNQTLTIGGNSTGFINIDSNSGQINLFDNTNINGNLTGLTGLTLASGAITLGGTTGTGSCLLGGSSASWGSCGTGGYGSPFRELTGAIVQLNTTEDFLAGGQASTSAAFKVTGQGNPFAGTLVGASVSANTSFAAFVIDNKGVGDIFTASSSGVPQFVVKNNGNVGIGLGTGTAGIPTAKLDVNGAASISSALTFRTGAGSIQTTAGNTLTIGGGTTGDIAMVPNTTVEINKDLNRTSLTGTSKGLLHLNGGPDFASSEVTAITLGESSSQPDKPLTIIGSQVTTNGSNLFFGTSNNYGSGITNTAQFIDYNGNIGLGTTTPLSELHVTRPLTMGANGKALAIFDQIENQDIFTASSSGSTRFTINKNGQVGINAGQNNSSPLATLDVRANLTNGGTLPVASISGKTSFAALTVDNSGLGDIFTASSSGLNRFVITQAGNVGIGTTRPLYAFDVSKKTAAFNSGQDGSISSWANTTNTGVGGQLEQFGLVFLNGYIYQVGGHTGSGELDTVQYARVKNDGTLDTWVTSPNRLPEVRLWHGTVTANGYIYAVGGANAVVSPTNPAVYYAKVNADGTVGAWATTTQLPSPRIRITHSVVVANGYMYVVGGENSSAQSTVWYSKINADGTLGNWQTGSSLPVATSDSAVIVDNGFIYSMGGNGGSTNAIYLAKINYDGSIGPWISNPNTLPNNEYMHSAIAVNGFVYVLGGVNNSTSVYYAKFNSDGTIPAFSTNPVSLPDSHQGSGITYGNGYIYISGGFGTDNVAFGSIARVSLAANLDLLGLTSTSIASSSGIAGGGSIFAGNIFAKNLEIGGSGTVWGNLAVSNTLSSSSLAISGKITGKALTIINETGNQAIFTASASGVTKFTIGNDGQVMIGNLAVDPSTSLGAGSVYYNTASQALKFYNGSTWSTIGSGASSPFKEALGAIIANQPTEDFLLGGNATSSAKFSVLNLNTGTPVASVSAQDGSNKALALFGNGSIQAARNNTLTLGGNTTGDISFLPGNASTPSLYVQTGGKVGLGTANPLTQLHISGNGPSIYIANAGESISTKLFLAPGNDNYLTGTLTGDSGIQLHTGAGFTIGSSNVQFKVTSTGNLGVGTINAPTGIDATSRFQVYSTLGTNPAASISARSTATPVLLVTSDDANNGDLFVASVSGQPKFRIDSSGGIHNNGGLSNDYGDFAEYYKKANPTEQFEAGQLVCIEGNGVVKCSNTSPSQRILGIISDRSFLRGNASHANDPSYVLVGMVGQLGIWVNGDVKAGDPLTFSSTPGVATVATTSTNIIGYAQEANNGNVKRIESVIQPTYFNPNTAYEQKSVFDSLTLGLQNGVYTVFDTLGNSISHIDAFSKAMIGNLTAGFASIQTLAVNTFTAATSSLGDATASTFAVAANTITIGGQDIRQFIIDTVRNAGFGQGSVVSPLASDTVRTNVVSPLADNSTVQLNANKDNFELKNTDTGKTVAWFNSQGNATFSGQLTSEGVQTSNATVSGTLAANSITTTDASVSGTITANTIVANNISGLDQKLATLAAALQNNSASNSGQNTNNYLASDTIHANFGIFEQGITSMGPVTSNIITATDQLAVGNSFTITNNSINTVGADLQIQSLRQGNIAFEGGLIKMDTDGNMLVSGNLNLLGEIDAVHGVFSGTLTAPALATGLISPLPGDDLAIRLSDSASTSGRLKIVNQQNQEVLSVNSHGDLNASGSGTFAKLNFNLVGKAEATSLTEAVATGSAGFATLRQGQVELTIKNPIITSKSLIYVTPYGDTNNKVIYLLRQVPQSEVDDGSFTVGISGTPTPSDLQFNWLVVN